MSDDLDIAATQNANPDVLQPIPVHASPIEAAAPEYGSWTTYTLAGTEPAQRILPQSNKRSAATIIVGPGFVNNNTNGYVRVGSRAQVAAPASADLRNPPGAVLASGYSMSYHAQQEVWLVPDGTNSLTVTVLDERYR